MRAGEPAVPDQHHEGGGHLPQDQVLPHQAAAPGAAITIVEGVAVLLLVIYVAMVGQRFLAGQVCSPGMDPILMLSC